MYQCSSSRCSDSNGAATSCAFVHSCRATGKAKLTTRKAYGFRSYRCVEIALYHTLGQLPEPEATHRFC
jgi:hypothetical protein